MIKTVIFDFDGVLANTLPYSLKKIIEISRLLKITSLTEKQIINEIRTKSYQDLLKNGMKLQWFKLPFVMLIVKKMQHKLYDEIETVKIFPGIKKLLTELKKRGCTLAIISSNLEKNVVKFLEIHKIKEISFIDCGSHILGKSQAIDNFFKKHRLIKKEAIYIGDEIRDVEACKKSGIKIIGVSWGLAKTKVLKEYNADFIVKKPLEILKILNNI